MKYDQVLIRFGDLMLKGKNRHTFISLTTNLIKQNIKDLNLPMLKTHDRIYLKLQDISQEVIKERLLRVSGLNSFSFVKVTNHDINNIVDICVELVNEEIKEEVTFKIETKRAYKQYPLTSLEFTKEVAPLILKRIKPKLTIDVKNPKETLYIEIREEATYIYLKKIKGIGGFPVGVGGKASLLLSGGIDSPVSAYLAMKQGLYLEGIHFESTPMTSIESVQKVIDISKKLALYTPKHEFLVLMVPFMKIHKEILTNIPDSYTITIMRRAMFKIAEKISNERGALAVVTGESVGQVASQTLESIRAITDVVRIPILRPLLTYDKQDIIDISRNIGTYNISIRPFEDCCSIYVPVAPTTKPTIKRCRQYEGYIKDFDCLIEEAVKETKIWVIKPDSNIDLSLLGFEMKEAWESINK
ncbi:MAG: tRNA 4-thiouridine(8) synthase ThiI [Acholeplasmataceae bacterium]|nr:tRNA 4-thiouridine(8) synthase ThiI [Acholeplasmataceae bacterium]